MTARLWEPLKFSRDILTRQWNFQPWYQSWGTRAQWDLQLRLPQHKHCSIHFLLTVSTSFCFLTILNVKHISGFRVFWLALCAYTVKQRRWKTYCRLIFPPGILMLRVGNMWHASILVHDMLRILRQSLFHIGPFFDYLVSKSCLS